MLIVLIAAGGNGDWEPTPYQQWQSDQAEAKALEGMVGLVVISSYWDQESSQFVAQSQTVEA